MRGTWQTTGSGGGGGLGQVAAVVVALMLAATIAPAVALVAHVVAVVVTVAVIVVASLAGLAVLGGLALVAVRVRRRVLSGPRAVRGRVVVVPDEMAEIAGRAGVLPGVPHARSLPAARNDVSAYPRVHATPHVVTSRAPRPRCPRQGGRRS